MGKMTEEECRSFLASPVKTAKVATVRKDARPHVVPVWFDLDGDVIVFMTGERSIKAANMRRDPRVCICVDDENPPFAFVQIEGIAALSSDPDQLTIWATRIAGRYMGQDLAETYGKRNAVPGELLVRINPTKIVGYKDVAS